VTVRIGTSGWQYKDWRGAFYPPKLAQVRWLSHYVAHFATVELNASFYRQPKPTAFVRWRVITPADFVMTVKASRFLTHIRRLREPEESVARLLDGALRLRAKLGPILVQLPPTLPVDVANLARTLAAFPTHLRVAVEVRHPSWYVDEVRALLSERNAALVWADRRSKLLDPPWRTADWAFLRFHHGLGTPQPCYGRTALAARAGALADTWGPDADAYVYFNNDPRCCAVRDARLFALACDRLGLARTRVPGPRDVTVVGTAPPVPTADAGQDPAG
jgi:uncharacterized protein YecE (DUF72 family)